MRALGLLALGLISLLGACDPKSQAPSARSAQPDTAPPAPAAADDAVAPIPPADEPIASGEGLSVGLADYELGLLRLRLLGAEPSPSQLADASFQRSMALACVRSEVIRGAAKELGVVVDAGQRAAYVASHPKLAGLDGLAPDAQIARLAERVGSSPDAVQRVLDDVLLERGLSEALLARVGDDELWAAYQRANTRVALSVVRFLNVPSSAEIGEAVRTRQTAITAYYAKHRERYERPERVRLRRFVIALDANADEAAQLAARARIETLRRRAALEDAQSLVREASEDPELLAKDGIMPPIPRSRFPEAFDLPVGGLTEPRREALGYVFYRVEERLPAQARELDASLERELASLLIQADGAAPSVAALAQRAAEALRAGDDDALTAVCAEGFSDRYELPLFALGNDANLPGLGYLPMLQAAILALEGAPAVTAPLHEGEYVWVAKLIAREDAKREEYERRREAFAAEWRTLELGRTLERFVAERTPADLVLQLRPVQRRYGVLRNDGSVMMLDGAGTAP